MTPAAEQSWSQQNDAYLSASLEWLRLRLKRLGALDALPVVEVKEPDQCPPQQPHFNWLAQWLFGPAPTPPRNPRKLEAPPPAIDWDQAIADAGARMNEAEAMDPPPALVILANRFGLTRLERDILLLCVAIDLDSGMSALCGRALGDSGRGPTFALSLALFDAPAWDVMSPERPLRFWRLIEISQGSAQPLTASTLRADERVLNYVKGLNYVDDRLTALLTPLATAPDMLPPSQESIASNIVTGASSYSNAPPVIHLMVPDVHSKQWIARRACQALNLSLMKLGADLLPANSSETENLARLWQRECALLPLALYLDAQDADKELPALNRFLTRTTGLVFLGTREALPGLAHEALGFDVSKPTRHEQRDVWAGILGQKRNAEAISLAAQFNFSMADIQRNARQSQGTDGTPDRDRLWSLCLLSARPHLDALAQRIDAKADWDALVIAEQERTMLMQIASQARSRMKVYDDWGFGRRMNRGMGLTALFAGESGTGKTMAAEVIANELRLNLHRIDLSGVVSKYIGESEKNLRRVFDAAEDGGTILFDEADALFGKRSEVKDSHDRYANIEVNYLLQRMEAFNGLAILATNMKNALDPAFVRRLRFIVNFAFPGAAERKRIWEKALPKETPRERLDFDRLSRLNLTGASIHSIALNAAFLAAGAGKSVNMRLVMDAARTEFRKLDKPVSDADFQWVEVKGAVA